MESFQVNNLREAESCYRRISDQLTANYISLLTFSNWFFFPCGSTWGEEKKRAEAELAGSDHASHEAEAIHT